MTTSGLSSDAFAIFARSDFEIFADDNAKPRTRFLILGAGAGSGSGSGSTAAALTVSETDFDALFQLAESVGVKVTESVFEPTGGTNPAEGE